MIYNLKLSWTTHLIFFFIFKYSMEKRISTRGQEAERLQDRLIKGKWNKTGMKGVEYLSERSVRKQTD